MKSRGVYETPGGNDPAGSPSRHRIDHARSWCSSPQGRADAEICELIYNGFWFSPEREMLQALIDKSQEFVTGRVRLKLYKGTARVVGRESPYSLYDQDLVTFEEALSPTNHRDAAGFIKLNALRLRRSENATAAAQVTLG